MSKSKKIQFHKDEIIKYVGKGFLNFDKSKPQAKFISYGKCTLGIGMCYIWYGEKNEGCKVLVYNYEIEKL